MKFFVAVAVTLFVAACEATFFGKGSGNVQLSGNFHGLAGHPWLGAKQPEAPLVVTDTPVIITEAPIIVSEAPVENKGHKFDIHGILQNHRLLSGAGSGFSLQGNLQGLFKNHRLLAGHFNKNQAQVQTTTEDPFGGDNTGYSVSTGESGNSFSESGNSEINTIPEIVEAVPVSNDAVISGSSGSSVSGSFTAKGGHNFHKIIGWVFFLCARVWDKMRNESRDGKLQFYEVFLKIKDFWCSFNLQKNKLTIF